MEVITNNFLKTITANPFEEIFEMTIESPKLKELDERMTHNSVVAGFKLLIKNSAKLKRLYSINEADEEKEILIQFSPLVYYITLVDKTELRRQLKHCQELLKSDICMRNVMLAGELEVEAQKLESAINTDHVKITCTYLNNLYKNVYKNWNKSDRYVRISEIMNIFSIPNFPYFYTITEAKKHLSKIIFKLHPLENIL
jgi:hypothetical protein